MERRSKNARPHHCRICVSITARTTREALVKMEEGFAQADILELRIDGIQRVNLKKLVGHNKGEIVITNRVKEEGGDFAGEEKERVALLLEAVALGADYVDVELRTAPVLIARLKKKIEACRGQTKLILSYHNFERTPSLEGIKKETGRRICGRGGYSQDRLPCRRDGGQSQGPGSHPLCPKKAKRDYRFLHGRKRQDEPGHGPFAGFLLDLCLPE